MALFQLHALGLELFRKSFERLPSICYSLHELMSAPLPLRIFSDLHFGDHASTLTKLESLTPLFEGASACIFNGDTTDTRRGTNPTHTQAVLAEVEGYFAQAPLPCTFLTGNHDPDISTAHALDLAGGQVFVTHGDIIFKDIVPWSRDVYLVRSKLQEHFEALPSEERERFEARMRIYRNVAVQIPQRHQAERNRFKYALEFLKDTVWPPNRAWRVMNTWRKTPGYAEDLLKKHRPNCRFFIMGHTHRAGSWRRPSGIVVLNTGSFCHPYCASVVDLYHDRLELRQITRKGDGFRLGKQLATHRLSAWTKDSAVSAPTPPGARERR